VNGKQTLVAFIGAALIIANLVTNRSASTGASGIASTIFGTSSSTATLTSAHSEFLGIAAEVGVLIFLIVISGTSDMVANIAMVFTIGLAMIWALSRYGGLNISNAASAVGGVTSGVSKSAA
jgi:hypothetical protein